ncbi:UDP-N-acetylmuramate--L-alanine ligase [candidate division WOR-3 bacterium]|nr:UDP-N-acetylmuramate--L-alanine ligase [candidate division WOR-3 bacterium]
MFRHINHIHFVGIGGSGMSGIAEVLIRSGYKVTGSDIKRSAVTDRLERLGAAIVYRHRGENVKNSEVLVYSSAIKDSNPEIVAAQMKGIPIIPRAEMLGELMRMKQGIAIAGTHGKTTTTSIVARILEFSGYDPTVVVGGRIKNIGTGGKLGEGEYFVCEADESDRSFLCLSPVISMITSIDADHLDLYKDIEEIKAAFVEFANRVPFYGFLILAYDDENVKGIIEKVRRRTITYGLSRGVNVLGYDLSLGVTSEFSVKKNRDKIGRFSFPLPGKHYVTNAVGAIALGLELEIPGGCLRDAVAGFEGVERRFEFIRKENIRIIDDYAHHPKEIEETIKAARLIQDKRIIIIFQPHLYSRTFKLLDGFAKSLGMADEVIVTDIYPAREEPIPGVTGKIIVDKMIKNGKKALYIQEIREIAKYVKKMVKRDDMILTLGAGNIRKVALEINKIL